MIRTSRTLPWLILLLMCSSALWSIPGSYAEDDPTSKAKTEKKDDTTSVWMKKKLEYSQNILSGLASADFDKIAANAESMQGLSKVEGFIRSRTPGYRTQLHIFEHANQEIIEQANKDNVEGAALAFTQLTFSCVNCHKTLRESMRK